MIKLYYFDFNFWRLDICRLSLSYGNIPYEYIKIPRKDWMTIKKKGNFPFGQLPVMKFKKKNLWTNFIYSKILCNKS